MNLFTDNLVLWVIIGVVVFILVINKMKKKEKFTADVNDKTKISEQYKCDISCCSNDPYVPHVKMGAPEGQYTSNMSCSEAQKGCVCLTEEQRKQLISRGGNLSKK